RELGRRRIGAWRGDVCPRAARYGSRQHGHPFADRTRVPTATRGDGATTSWNRATTRTRGGACPPHVVTDAGHARRHQAGRASSPPAGPLSQRFLGRLVNRQREMYRLRSALAVRAGSASASRSSSTVVEEKVDVSA